MKNIRLKGRFSRKKMKEDRTNNPWLCIWIYPAKTIQTIINTQLYKGFVILCLLQGMASFFLFADTWELGTLYSLPLLLFVSLLLAIPIGYLCFSLTSVIVFLTGKLIRGRASYKEVRAAVSWSSVPTVFGYILFWAMVIFTADFRFNGKALVEHLNSVRFIGLAFNGLMIWGTVLWICTMAQVQHFSKWMALLNLFLAGLIVGVFAFLAIFAVKVLSTDGEGDHVQLYQTRNSSVVIASCGSLSH